MPVTPVIPPNVVPPPLWQAGEWVHGLNPPPAAPEPKPAPRDLPAVDPARYEHWLKVLGAAA